MRRGGQGICPQQHTESWARSDSPWGGDKGSRYPILILPTSPLRREQALSCPRATAGCQRVMLLVGGRSTDEQSHLAVGSQHKSLLPPWPFLCSKAQGSDSTANPVSVPVAS